MTRIRAGAGLGDSIYLRAIVQALIERGERVTALSDYPGIFQGSGADVEPFRRHSFDLVAHYVNGKRNPKSTQWEDICEMVRMPGTPLRFPWRTQNEALVREVRDRARGLPVILVHGGRIPMGRKDGFGMEVLPARAAFETALSSVGSYTILVGAPDQQAYPLRTSLDLSGRTSVSDLADLAQACDGVLAQCSWAIPLAEVFDKPLFCIWSSKVASAAHPYVRAITPEKVIHKKALAAWAYDDTDPRELAADFFGKRLEVAA